MDDPERATLGVFGEVRVVKRLAHLHEQMRHRLRRQPPLTFGPAVPDGLQAVPVDVLHRDEVLALGLPEIEDLGDVRVAQLDGELRLVDEHLDRLGVARDVREDPLDRHRAGEAGRTSLHGAKDLGHPADADALEELVAAEALLHRHEATTRSGSTTRQTFARAAVRRRDLERGAVRVASARLIAGHPERVSEQDVVVRVSR